MLFGRERSFSPAMCSGMLLFCGVGMDKYREVGVALMIQGLNAPQTITCSMGVYQDRFEHWPIIQAG
jgi:hypothetical protein